VAVASGLSADGLHVGIDSIATNLMPKDTRTEDGYVADAFAPF
jgi:hypothetical protein